MTPVYMSIGEESKLILTLKSALDGTVITCKRRKYVSSVSETGGIVKTLFREYVGVLSYLSADGKGRRHSSGNVWIT